MTHHEPPVPAEREAPEQITYNPVYQVTYEGADPTRGYVYTRVSTPPARPGRQEIAEAVRSLLDDKVHAEARRLHLADATQSGYEHHLIRVAGEMAITRFCALAAPASDGLRSARSDTDLLNALRDECWDLRCMSVATGGDDYDAMWKVVGHWMADPVERIVAEGWSDDPRVAIRAALDQLQSGEGGE